MTVLLLLLLALRPQAQPYFIATIFLAILLVVPDKKGEADGLHPVLATLVEPQPGVVGWQRSTCPQIRNTQRLVSPEVQQA